MNSQTKSKDKKGEMLQNRKTKEGRERERDPRAMKGGHGSCWSLWKHLHLTLEGKRKEGAKPKSGLALIFTVWLKMKLLFRSSLLPPCLPPPPLPLHEHSFSHFSLSFFFVAKITSLSLSLSSCLYTTLYYYIIFLSLTLIIFCEVEIGHPLQFNQILFWWSLFNHHTTSHEYY